MNGQMVKRLGVLLVGLGFSGIAAAHPGHVEGAGILAGLLHPLTGWDHLLAALAVGLVASRERSRQAWLLPLLFVSVMLAGVGLAAAGVTLWQPEWMIIASLLVLGAMLFFDYRPAQFAAAGLIGLFAVFHGYLHGSEMPLTAHPFGYVAGLLAATFTVHVSGILLGRFSHTAWVKIYGLVIGSAGVLAVVG